MDSHLDLTVKYAILLHKLATDDRFREALRENPRGAMAESGIQLDERLIPKEVTLPEKARIRGEFGSFLTRYASGQGNGPFGKMCFSPEAMGDEESHS